MESDVLTAGDDVTIANTEFGKIGIGICYDIRFPELARLMALEGASILFYPGAFNMTTGPAHWELLFRTRALDNQVFCVGVAPALNKDASYHSFGHSIITSPWGEVISEATEKEELIISEIDLSEIKKIFKEVSSIKPELQRLPIIPLEYQPKFKTVNQIIPTEEEILAMMAEIRENPQELRFVA